MHVVPVPLAEVSEVVPHAVVHAVERVEAAVGRSHVVVAETEVPLAHHVGLVPQGPKLVRQQLVLQRQRPVLHSSEDGVLKTHPERVDAREEGRSGGRANLLHVGVVQHHSFRSHLVDVGRVHFAVSEPDVIPSHVVGHYDQDVGSLNMFSVPVMHRGGGGDDEEGYDYDSKSQPGHLPRDCHRDDSLKGRKDTCTGCSHVLFFVRIRNPESNCC